MAPLISPEFIQAVLHIIANKQRDIMVVKASRLKNNFRFASRNLLNRTIFKSSDVSHSISDNLFTRFGSDHTNFHIGSLPATLLTKQIILLLRKLCWIILHPLSLAPFSKIAHICVVHLRGKLWFPGILQLRVPAEDICELHGIGFKISNLIVPEELFFKPWSINWIRVKLVQITS